jgi:hypothetical protein
MGDTLIKVLVPVLISVFGIVFAWGAYRAKFGIVEKVAYKNRANIEERKNELIKIVTSIDSLEKRCLQIEIANKKTATDLTVLLGDKIDKFEKALLEQNKILQENKEAERRYQEVVIDSLKMVSVYITNDVPSERADKNFIELLKKNSIQLEKLDNKLKGLPE